MTMVSKKPTNIQHSDPGSGTDFKSTTIISATFADDEGRQAVTIIGTGVNKGCRSASR